MNLCKKGLTGLRRGQASLDLCRCWRNGLVLRNREAILDRERISRGRAGVSSHARPYHLYMLRPEGIDTVLVDGRRFIGYSE